MLKIVCFRTDFKKIWVFHMSFKRTSFCCFLFKEHARFRDSQSRSLVFKIAILENLAGRDCIRYYIYFI